MNELWLFLDIVNGDPPIRFICEFAANLSDIAIFLFFAHRLFLKKRHSFAGANICVFAGAALLAFAGSMMSDFSPLFGLFCELFKAGVLLAMVCAVYKGGFAEKAAYTLTSMTVCAAADIMLANIMLLIVSDGHNYHYLIFANSGFVITFFVLQRAIRLAVMPFLFRNMRRPTVLGSVRSSELLCYVSIFPFCGVSLLGLFTTGDLHKNTAGFVLISAGAAAFIIGELLLTRFFPKISRFLQADEPVTNTPSAPSGDTLSAREIQKLRHDVRNNIATISALIDSGDSGEAKRLLSELGERLGKALGGENRTGVPSIDTAVGEKLKLCEKLGIAPDTHIEPLPETKIPPIDLSSLISNILDNAIEAAQQCEKPVLMLRIFKYKGYLAVICENSVNAAPRVVNGVLATAKKDGGHGYGIEIINDICKNNNGRFQYEFDDSTFKASAFLEL